MSKILQKSNIVNVPSIIQQVEQKNVNEHNAILDKFNELTTRLQEKINKVSHLENELEETKNFYENVIEEIEKKLSSLLIIK